MIRTKLVSGLEKVFADGRMEDYAPLERLSLLRGERIHFQVICEMIPNEAGNNFSLYFEPTLEGPLAKYATVRRVLSVPALLNGRASPDSDYICRGPRLVPDILAPLAYRGRIVLPPYNLVSLYIEIDLPADAAEVGESTLTVTLAHRRPYPQPNDAEPATFRETLTLDVIDAALPAPKLLFAQWFHSDCLAEYYGLEKWSDAHFEVIRKFARTAKRNGITMLFTPLISPPLDNAYDTRDLQLADVTVTDEGYAFSWEKLDRFVDIAKEEGFELFEIGHLFTQGGAASATKVMGWKGGEYVRLFPKDTPCDDPEYTRFLRAMLTSFLDRMRARGDDRRCYFHISDEPTAASLDTYLRAKATVADLLEGYPLMDALSHYEFYESGAVAKPIVLMDHLQEFLDHDVKGLWTYNCLVPDHGYSNRFLAMTLPRNRSISLMLYKFRIEGFLHWGYNFYNNSGSADPINPFLDTASGDLFPSGDAFSVYPGAGGEPMESLRLATFHEALEDLAAFTLCEALTSREAVLAALEDEVGEIRTSTYLNGVSEMHRLRERINRMIKDNL